jgi:nitrogen regulatory protein P-II 1
MKMIIAIIRPHALEDVRATLNEQGVLGVTVTEARGYGRQGGHTEIYRGAEYKIEFVPKLRVEIVVDADRKDEIVTAVAQAAKTGKVGDGKIFVLPVEEAMRVRTGERDKEAL